MAGCQADSCRYISGITKAVKRVGQVKGILEGLSIEPERIDAFHLSAGKGQEFVEVADRMVNTVKGLGPVLSA